MQYPLKFVPIYKDYLWGGRNLEKLGRCLPEGRVAESWEISAHPDGISAIANGALAGMTLPDYIAGFGQEVMGRAVAPRFLSKFPLLVKLIDAQQQLSVQVHPDDVYARTHENEAYGKTEMWYIITAEPGAKIIYHLRNGVTKDEWVAAIAENRLGDCLQELRVTAGDVVHIPAGTVHALGAGIMLAEIQQNSNATYRVYDYDRVDAAGRKRPLHIEKALEVMNFDLPMAGLLPIRPRWQQLSPEVSMAVLNRSSFFEVESYKVRGKLAEVADGSRFFIYTFLKGEGVIDFSDGTVTVHGPETVMIPAGLGSYYLEGSLEFLKTYLPLEEGLKPEREAAE